MDNHIIPPPPPPPLTPPPLPSASVKSVRRKMSYGPKIVLIGLQCCLLMIGLLTVWTLSYSRESTSNEVAEEISSDWGGDVRIDGPFVAKKLDTPDKTCPSTFVCNAQVAAKSLHRGIYEAEVFNSAVAISGTFDRTTLAAYGDSLVFMLYVPAKEISKLGSLKICGKDFTWSKCKGCLYADVMFADMPEKIDFSTEFDIQGSREICIRQIGKESSSTIVSGEAANPSFYGRLPNDRMVTDRNFKARWDSGEILESAEVDSGSAGVRFLVGVDRYQKVERSMKYAIVIILLTFVSVLFAEIVMRHPIPLLNYFLIGAALILFYTLLLAFSEHTTFGLAYLISGVMIVSLISGYMWRILNSWKVGIIIAVILSAIYVSCYIMLCISTYALLLGSFILFVSLAVMMYGSLKMNPNPDHG